MNICIIKRYFSNKSNFQMPQTHTNNGNHSYTPWEWDYSFVHLKASWRNSQLHITGKSHKHIAEQKISETKIPLRYDSMICSKKWAKLEWGAGLKWRLSMWIQLWSILHGEMEIKENLPHELRSPGFGNGEGPGSRQLGRPKAQSGPPRWKLAPGTS